MTKISPLPTGTSVDVYSTDWLLPRYGMYALDYADVYPELTAALRRLYLEKTAGIPWLPKDWRASIGSLHGQDGKLLVPASANAVDSQGNRAKFLVNQEQVAWWNEFVAMADDIRRKFMDGKLAEGRAAMEAAYNRSAFWTKAYNIATVLATPVTVVSGAANLAGSYPRVVQGVLIGGAALLLWYFFRRKD